MPNESNQAIIMAGSQLAGQGISAIAQANINKKTREWNEKMYGQQRADALADWSMQNLYNSPARQMARYKEAGLNPNLIYGQPQTTGPVRSSSVEGWHPQAPQVDLGAVGSTFVMGYANLKLKEEQVNVMKQQQDLMRREAVLKGLAGENIQQQIKESMFRIKKGESLLPGQATIQDRQIKKLEADTTYTLDQNERSKLLTANTLAQGVEEILLKRAHTAQAYATTREIGQKIQNLIKEGLIQDFEIELNKKGFTKHDPYYIRAGAKVVDAVIQGVKENMNVSQANLLLQLKKALIGF